MNLGENIIRLVYKECRSIESSIDIQYVKIWRKMGIIFPSSRVAIEIENIPYFLHIIQLSLDNAT